MMKMTYKGSAKKILKKFQVDIWDIVQIVLDDGSTIRAVILPGPETERFIYLKLENGYNVAYAVSRVRSIKKIGNLSPKYTLPKMKIVKKESLPSLTLIHCGGTIASRVEYATGAVAPAFSPEELSHAIPEIFDLADIRIVELFNIFSENMRSEHWIKIARTVVREFEQGARGIVITHGTDTLHFTSSALAFMLENLPGPVILTGAMRSSDRPASDAASNVIASVRFAVSANIGESIVVMHGIPSDTVFYAYRGVRCIKLHSSRRDAFKSIGIPPVAIIDEERYRIVARRYLKKKSVDELEVKPFFEKKTALVYLYPNISPEIIDFLVDRRFRGIVLVGTGLGHAPEYIVNSIRRAIEEGVIVVMTTQCLWGGVFMNVYESGRKLLKIGVIPAHTMLPHVAYVKLGWLLGQNIPNETVKELFLKNLRLEFIERESISAF